MFLVDTAFADESLEAGFVLCPPKLLGIRVDKWWVYMAMEEDDTIKEMTTHPYWEQQPPYGPFESQVAPPKF